MQHPTQTPQSAPNPPQAQNPSPAAQPTVTPSPPPTPAERKRTLATRLAIIGGLCVAAPFLGIFIAMAAVDSTQYSSDGAKAIASIVATIPFIAPLPGIGLLIASLVLRNQARKLSDDKGTPVVAAPTGVPTTHTATSSAQTTPPQPVGKASGSSWATPGKLFIIGVGSFVLMLIVGYGATTQQQSTREILSELAQLLLWVSIGFVTVSVIKAFSKDKKPPRQ